MCGKSTFLSVVTSATPKIADYHFTTLTPNLGVTKTKLGESFVIADIPGIIEGASEGVGLGIQFLRHVERTRLLLHFLDASGIEGRNPVEDFYIIKNELKKYNEKLSKRKQIIVANKADIIQDNTLYNQIIKMGKKENIEVFKISAATRRRNRRTYVTYWQSLKRTSKRRTNRNRRKSTIYIRGR